MRCIACNNILTTQEACTRFKSGTPTEMCTACLDTIDIPVQVPQRFLQKGGESFGQEEYGYHEDDIPPWEDEDDQGMEATDEWQDS
jgi:hypothetical protein